MAKAVKLSLKKLSAELAALEGKHGISSAEFYDRWLSGAVGDTPDLIPDAARWFELYEDAVLKGFPAPPEFVAVFTAARERPRTPAVVLTPEMILEELSAFEARHGESSASFYKRYTNGLAGCSPEAMEWASLYEWAVKERLVTPAGRA